MKTFLMAIAVLLFTGCASQGSTKLLYGSHFKLSLPSAYITGATVFYGDELGVKTSSGKVFAGQIVDNVKDKLPEDFDIRLYPEYILKLRPTTDLSSELASLFVNTSSEINYSYDINSLEVKKDDGRTIYSVCKKDECLAFVVKDDYKNHIFYAHTQKIGRTEFINLLSGGLDVNK